MQNPSRPPGKTGLWITLAVALAYCVWLGVHWLPLDYSDKELAAFVSRVWDVQRELKDNGQFPWWTPFYMSGSSYGLNHSQGLYLLPSLLFATFTDLHTAVKLTSLLAILAGALAMYGCARYFLKNEWAAALAGIAFLLHPAQVIRAAGAEHLGIIVFMPFMPLTFWLFARALDTGRWRDIFWCALAAFGLLWSHNKMAFVFGIFLAGYFCFHLRQWKTAAKLTGLIAGLSAILIVPGLVESKHVKLLSGEQDQLRLWQRGYAFKSLLALVDRDGRVTGATTNEISRLLQAQAFRPTTQAQADQMRDSIQRLFSMTADSPEKYAGIIALLVLAVTVLWNHRRQNRHLFWFLVGALLVSVMLSYGPSNVWRANWQTAQAVFSLPGVPMAMRAAVWLGLAAVAAFLVVFDRQKLNTNRKRLIAGIALAVFLFLPAFSILATVPFFKEIRAPYVFYDGPAAFFLALLVGFFVTDTKWSKFMPAVAVLLLLDYWPYQRPAKDNGVPARTLRNLEATYRSLPDGAKTYSLSGRYFHLLGPMYSGKPQVYEAFYNWMAPLGTGLLNQTGLSREMLNVFGARYIVCDKTDPQANPQILAQLRQAFPVQREDEDFLVLRNDAAHPYVSATTRLCNFTGDVRRSPQLALALAGKNYTLVHDGPRNLNYERSYDDHSIALPLVAGELLPLADVSIARENSHRIRIALTAPRECVAVIAESYYPYWHAEVNGTRANVLRVNTGLMGVVVPAGLSEVVLTYRPPGVYALAGGVSALAFAFGLVATIRSSRANRRRD